jgi:hypothetical protein
MITIGRRLLVLTLLLTGAGLGACSPVQPWERGDLAKPHMALDPDPGLRALRAHTFTSREAASGGGSAQGGGCGCD